MDDLLEKYERLLVATNNDMLPLKAKILKSQEFDVDYIREIRRDLENLINKQNMITEFIWDLEGVR